MADESLANDLIEAVVSLIETDIAYYSPFIGTYPASPGPGTQIRVENARPGNEQNIKGQQGVIGVSLEAFTILRTFDDSAHVQYDLMLFCDYLENAGSIHSSAMLARAFARSFGDGGARLFGLLTEETTAQLGESFSAQLGEVRTAEGEPGRPQVQATLSVLVWIDTTQAVPAP